MIVFDLECRNGQHRFEGWFKSSDDFARQRERALVECPVCGDTQVTKAVQAPRLARKGNQLPSGPTPPAASSSSSSSSSSGAPSGPAMAPAAPPGSAAVASAPLPPQAVEMIQQLARMQAEALKTSRYVGESFADDARAMHYGEREIESIHGQTTLAEAQELAEEGISVVPLPFPVLPPDQAN